MQYGINVTTNVQRVMEHGRILDASLLQISQLTRLRILGSRIRKNIFL